MSDVYALLPELSEISEPSDAQPGQFVATLHSFDADGNPQPEVYVVLSATYTNEVSLSDALDQLVGEYPDHRGDVWHCIDDESSKIVARVDRGSWSLR